MSPVAAHWERLRLCCRQRPSFKGRAKRGGVKPGPVVIVLEHASSVLARDVRTSLGFISPTGASLVL